MCVYFLGRRIRSVRYFRLGKSINFMDHFELSVFHFLIIDSTTTIAIKILIPASV